EEKFASHRQGQQLVGRLLRSLVERGRLHHAAGRLADALADVERAGRLGRGVPEVAELREAIAQAMSDRQRHQQQRQAALARARQCLDQGWLSGGAAAIMDLSDRSPEREHVERTMAMQEAKIQATLRQSETAIAVQDWIT